MDTYLHNVYKVDYRGAAAPKNAVTPPNLFSFFL